MHVIYQIIKKKQEPLYLSAIPSTWPLEGHPEDKAVGTPSPLEKKNVLPINPIFTMLVLLGPLQV
jgi:hypothetical protein